MFFVFKFNFDLEYFLLCVENGVIGVGVGDKE